MLKKISISNKLLSFEMMKESWGENRTVFNIDNNKKCFSSTKSAYYNAK